MLKRRGKSTGARTRVVGAEAAAASLCMHEHATLPVLRHMAIGMTNPTQASLQETMLTVLQQVAGANLQNTGVAKRVTV